MKNISIVLRAMALVALVALSSAVSAQVLRSGYFIDGNPLRYRLNPALKSTRGHFSLPLLGGVNVNTSGNVGLADFLYKSADGDGLVTFMHPSVEAGDFLASIERDNRVVLDMDLTLFSLAFHAFGGFNSVDFTFRSMTGVSLPYDMLRFMKVAGEGEYDFGNLNLHTRNYADLSIGHSRRINGSLTVGARMKLLLGLAYADATFNKMNLCANADRWEIMARGSADVAIGGHFDVDDKGKRGAVNGYDGLSAGVHGMGFGADLGAQYEFLDGALSGLTLSASVNDLGFISWQGAAHAAIEPYAPYTFDGFKEIDVNGDGDGLDEQWEQVADDLEEFFTLEDRGTRNVTESIGAKVNLAAEYAMPFWRRMSVGLLYTGCFDGLYSYNQAMLALNVSPANFLDFVLSGHTGTYGAGFGALMNIHCPGFGLFVGTDCFLGKVSKQYIPLENMNTSVSFGINIALGKE